MTTKILNCRDAESAEDFIQELRAGSALVTGHWSPWFLPQINADRLKQKNDALSPFAFEQAHPPSAVRHQAARSFRLR